MRKVFVSLLLLLLLTLSLGLTSSVQAQGIFPPLGGGTPLVQVEAALSQALAAAQPSERLRVVAVFNGPLSVLQRQTLLGLVTRGQVLQRLPIALLELTPAQVTLVRTLPGLRALYLDKELSYAMHESVRVIGADRVWDDLGYDGAGVTVAVVDSGIDGLHPDLSASGKVKANVKIVGQSDLLPNFYLPVPLPNSDTTSGHGTHVAGTVAGTGAASGGYYRGVAPGADLVGVGTGDAIFIFTALAAFDWVLANQQQYSIDVVTNSWGSSGAFDANDPINVASKALHDAGMVVLFASGNEGPAANTLNPYSVAPWVIGVAAGNKDGATLADFSSRGIPNDGLYHPTITAPGADIVSARAPNTILPVLGITSDTAIQPTWIPFYTTMSGTSMATPHMAGVVALMLEANPTLSPDTIKEILVETATPMAGYSEYEVGAGYANAFAAVEEADAR